MIQGRLPVAQKPPSTKRRQYEATFRTLSPKQQEEDNETISWFAALIVRWKIAFGPLGKETLASGLIARRPQDID
jgi:hypothetical protein